MELSRFSSHHTASAILVGMVSVAGAGLLHLATPLNHDAAWHFQTAFIWLNGARVGYEIFDINPPMTMLISAIPALIVKATGFDPTIVFKLFTIVVLATVYAISVVILRTWEMTRKQEFVFVLFLSAALFGIAGYDFAQREHLTAALTLPYVLLAIQWTRQNGTERWIAVLVGVLAGVGIGIKPYFLALPLCVELSLLVYRRCWMQFLRIELLAIVAVGFLYLGAVLIFAPGYYFEVIPAALSNYAGFEAPLSRVLLTYLEELFLAASVVTLMAFLVGRPWRSLQAGIILAAGFGFLVAAVLQAKGWQYQVLPVKFYLTIAAGMIATQIADRHGLARMFAPVFVLALVANPTIVFVRDMLDPDGTKARVDRLADIFGQYAGAEGPVFAFITSPRDVHPAILQSRTRWVGSSGAMVYLPACFGTAPEEKENPVQYKACSVTERYDRLMILNLVKEEPKIVVSQFGRFRLAIAGMETTYPEYFSRYPAFRSFWENYSLLETVGSFRVFVRQ